MLLRAALPTPTVALPNLLSSAQMTDAKQAVTEAQDANLIKKTDFIEILESCNIDTVTPKHVRESIRALDNVYNIHRADLNKLSTSDPYQRLQIHQAMLASGYYQRIFDPYHKETEPQLFLANHYNHDVRIDPKISKALHKLLVTEDSEYRDAGKLAADVLSLERHLFGQGRLFTVNNKQNLMLGIPFVEIKDADHLERILEQPTIKKHGNFTHEIVPLGDLNHWRQQTVACGPEEGMPFVSMSAKHTRNNCTDKFQHKIPIARVLTRKERITNFLLRAWVGWITLWGMFWAVDEEIITLIALLYAKMKSMRNLEKLAEDAGGSKIYVAHKPNFYTAKERFNLY